MAARRPYPHWDLVRAGVLYGSAMLALAIVPLLRRQRMRPEAWALAIPVVGMVANGFVMAAPSAVDGREQGRIVWILPVWTFPALHLPIVQRRQAQVAPG